MKSVILVVCVTLILGSGSAAMAAVNIELVPVGKNMAASERYVAVGLPHYDTGGLANNGVVFVYDGQSVALTEPLGRRREKGKRNDHD